jgi:LysM repeat protein
MSLAVRTFSEPVSPASPHLVPVPPLRLVPEPPARRKARRSRSAVVVPLFAPSAPAAAPPLRLTRRGVAAVALLVIALSGALLALAAHSAHGTSHHGTASAVVVRPGDTLWSIATRVAPDVDPRAEVSRLQRLNDLVDTTLRPGEVLQTR